MSSSIDSPPQVLRQGLGLNLELADWIDWLARAVQGSCLHSTEYWDCSCVTLHLTNVCEGLELGPHIFRASTLLTEPFPSSHLNVP